MRDNSEDPGTPKQYEIAYPALARYFHTHFESGVQSMQLIMEQRTTDKTLPNDRHYVENTKTSIYYWFEDGAHVSLASWRDDSSVVCQH